MAMSRMYSLEWRSPSPPTRQLQTYPGAVAGRRFTVARLTDGRRRTSKHCTIRTCYRAATTVASCSAGNVGEMGRKAQFVDVVSSPIGCCAATTVAIRPAENVVEIGRKEQRVRSPAAVLGIGTANPVNCVRQDAYPDYYSRVTQSAHLPELKARMKRLCDKSGIEKRYFHHTEKMIRDHPEFLDRTLSSVDPRQDILRAAVPDLAAAAALDAVAEWGRPASDITHLIMSTYSGAHMPGADLGLSNLLGLSPSVQRTMLYLSGCTSASTALRVAKDIAENNPGARVLVACAELTLTLFRGPEEQGDASSLDTVIMQSLFGDGAGAVIIGAECDKPVERPLFDMLSASQTVIPGMGDQPAAGQLSEAGMVFHPSRVMPTLVRQKIEQCVVDALQPLDLSLSGGWNDLFWAVQPTGRAVLDGVQEGLGLKPGKLDASRRVLRDYGYMSGASMMYVLDELRRRSACHGEDGLPGALGVMLGIGPGFSVETMLMRRSSE